MMAKVKKIVVASTNPVKIQSTERGFEKMFPNEKFEVQGISVKSGVSDQPMSETETKQGARNRMNSCAEKIPEADFWVGIEGGLAKSEGEMEAYAWVIIKSKQGIIGKGRTASFFLPQLLSNLIEEGHELGEASDLVFKKHNSKQHNGSIGILTGDVINRSEYYIPAVVLALIPFKNPELY